MLQWGIAALFSVLFAIRGRRSVTTMLLFLVAGFAGYMIPALVFNRVAGPKHLAAQDIVGFYLIGFIAGFIVDLLVYTFVLRCNLEDDLRAALKKFS